MERRSYVVKNAEFGTRHNRTRYTHWSRRSAERLPKLNLAKIMELPEDKDNKSRNIIKRVDLDDSNDSIEQDSEEINLYSEKRNVEYTPYGASIKNALNDRNVTDFFTVATFNVLSQTLLHMHRHLYTYCHKRYLKWSARKARLLKDFEYLNPDVLCLQEVEARDLNFYETELEKLGYVGIFKKRTHDKVDGCAIFFKHDKFDMVEYRLVELFKDRVKLLDRDNVGVILKLAMKNDPSRSIVVATTHLLFTTRRTDIRLTQTQMMLAEIERFAYKGLGSYLPIVYCGDMNYTPESPVYELVTKGFVQYDCRGLQLPYHMGTPKDLLPKFVGVTDYCQFSHVLNERSDKYKKPIHGSGALHHGLNLSSVYEHVKGGSKEASTFQDQWHTVDYIFYSRSSSSQEPTLELVSRLSLPSSEEAESDLGHLPNEYCGSDHLPLLATFHLSSPPR